MSKWRRRYRRLERFVDQLLIVAGRRAQECARLRRDLERLKAGTESLESLGYLGKDDLRVYEWARANGTLPTSRTDNLP